MALSIGEANAVSTVLHWLGVPDFHGIKPSDERALAALLLLREKAYKTLSAGPTEEEVRAAFKAAAERLRRDPADAAGSAR